LTIRQDAVDVRALGAVNEYVRATRERMAADRGLHTGHFLEQARAL